MEAMGQMGNSEEAVLPDDLPFDMYDLEVEEDDVVEMNTGGLLPSSLQPSTAPMTAPTGQYSATGMTTPNIGTVPGIGQAVTPITAASASPYTTGQVDPNLPGTAFTPTAITPVTPTFQETIGAGVVGVDYEFVEFTNEAGQVIRLRRNKATGQIIDPIPEGFSEKVKEEEQVETTSTTGVGTQTTQVRDDGDDKGDRSPTGATTAFGGTLENGRVVGGYVGDLSFDNMSISDIQKFGMGIPGSLLGQLQGKPNTNTIPNDAIASVTNLSKTRPDGVYSGPAPVEVAATVRMSGKSYNDLLTGKNVTQRQRMSDAIDFIKDKYGDQVMDPNKIINLDIELADMDMREDVRDAIDRSDFTDSIKDSLSRNNDIGNVSVDRNGNLSINNPFEAARIAKEDMKDYSYDSGKDDPAPSAPSGPSGPSFDDSAVGRGSEDRGGGGPEGGEGQPGGMGVICLTEDMKVKRNGVIDFVTNVKVGDIVDNTVVTEVLHKHMREGYYVVNGELKITNDHPVLANGSWKRTEDLVLGDYINSVEVTSLEYVDQVTPTVYIGTADDRYNVYTEGEVYTIHGQYKNINKQAA
ncbi:MAG: hypothetical protein CBB98_10020 [Rhodobacteraceae bacterium TMED38]|nr:MAG: hypothetical protein CBB98_10020 [Rhodobacteraceae bacterium TMED38]